MTGTRDRETAPTPGTTPSAIAECIPGGLSDYLVELGVIGDREDLRSTMPLGRSQYVPETCAGGEVYMTSADEPRIHGDRVFILPVSDDLITDSPAYSFELTEQFYEYFEDEFDFLFFVQGLYRFEYPRIIRSNFSPDTINPSFVPVRNFVQGIGRPISAPGALGPTDRLQGEIWLPSYGNMGSQGILLHELMHRWANHIFPSPSYGHWAFISADGIVGGFDIEDLEDLGGGRYAVRNYWGGGGSFGSRRYFSPIELYLVGLVPPEQVPDLWVGEDVEWVLDQDGEVALQEGEYRIFKPQRVRIYSIEDIIAEHGERVPDHTESQRDFRAAVILLIDENHPATTGQLDLLTHYIDTFTFPGMDRLNSVNFYEATGGRATISMGELSTFLKRGGPPAGDPSAGRPSAETVGEAREIAPVFKSIAAGSNHACGVTTEASVVCWGDNFARQSLPPEGEFLSVTAGESHSCGLMTDGTITCWGDGFYRQQMVPDGKFVSVSAGSKHNCAVGTNGSVTCWGYHWDGQATPPEGPFDSVSSGVWHSCGVRTDGSVSCWGNDDFGQSTPPRGEFSSVSTGTFHACGVMDDGALACWGSDEFGQATPPPGEFLSVSTGDSHSCGLRSDRLIECWGDETYFRDMPRGSGFISVIAHAGHTCALHAEGNVVCWGDENYLKPIPVEGDFTYVGTGRNHSCGLRNDGTVACWGEDDHGRSTPPAVQFAQLSTGDSHNCGLTTSGTAACWGFDGSGQSSPPQGRFVSTSAGGRFSCGVKGDGSIACWGSNEDHQGNHLGQATPPTGQFTSVSAGGDHACGIKTDGSIACWGDDEDGQATPPPGQFASVSTGFSHTCGLTFAGRVECWGYDFYGQSTPPRGRFDSVDAGWWHSCGVRDDGAVVCWGISGGINNYGQAAAPEGRFTSVSAGLSRSCGARTDGSFVCWGELDSIVLPNGCGDSRGKSPKRLWISNSLSDKHR